MNARNEQQVLAQTKRSRRIFLIMVLLFGLPYVFAWGFMQFRSQLPTLNTSNHGDLISPVRSIADIQLTALDGKLFHIHDLQGKWLLVTVADSRCEQRCQQNLYHIRQIRKAVGSDRRRVQRLLIVSNTDALSTLTKTLEDYKGMVVGTGPAVSVTQVIEVLKRPNPNAEDGIYIIDPLGNLMMSYPPAFDATLILKDLRRLLKVSQVG